MRFTVAMTLDEVMDELHLQGWSMGDVGGPEEWLVTGTKDGQSIRATGSTRQRAWVSALDQSRLHGKVIQSLN